MIVIQNWSDQITAGQIFTIIRCNTEPFGVFHYNGQMVRAYDQRRDRVLQASKDKAEIQSRRIRFVAFMFWADRVSTASRDTTPIRGDGLGRMREQVLHSDPIMYYDHTRMSDDMPEMTTLRDDDGNLMKPYHRSTRYIDPYGYDHLENTGQIRRYVAMAAMFIWADTFYPDWVDYNPPLGIRRLGYLWEDAESSSEDDEWVQNMVYEDGSAPTESYVDWYTLMNM